jgi:diaminopimelate decarboxylase
MSYVIATLVTRYELDANAEVFGALCCALTAGPCFVASVFFYLGGIEYEKIMIEKDKKTAEALEKAEKEQIDLSAADVKTRFEVIKKSTLIKKRRRLYSVNPQAKNKANSMYVSPERQFGMDKSSHFQMQAEESPHLEVEKDLIEAR